jgi:hypothetical protein
MEQGNPRFFFPKAKASHHILNKSDPIKIFDTESEIRFNIILPSWNWSLPRYYQSKFFLSSRAHVVLVKFSVLI